MERSDRALIIIGGKEDRSADKIILREIGRRVGSGKLVVSTVAMPGETESLFNEYEKAFRAIGVKHVYQLEIDWRRHHRSTFYGTRKGWAFAGSSGSEPKEPRDRN